MNQNELSLNSSPEKAAELSGVAGGFCCLSLHRAKIFQRFLRDAGYAKYFARRCLSSALALKSILLTAGTVVPMTFAISSYGISSYRRRIMAKRCDSGSRLIAS